MDTVKLGQVIKNFKRHSIPDRNLGCLKRTVHIHN